MKQKIFLLVFSLLSFVANADYDELNNLRFGEVESSPSIIDLDLCRYFPQPAQAWKTNSSLTINSAKDGEGLYPNYYISGWSEQYVNDNLTPCGGGSSIHNCQSSPGNGVIDKLQVPFGRVVDWSNLNSCEDGTCVAGNSSGMITKPDDVNVSFTSNLKVTIDDVDYIDDCDYGSKCNAYLDPNDNLHIIVEINKDLESLTVHDSSEKRITVKFKPNIKVKNYIVNGKAHTEFASGKFYFNTVKFNHSGLSVRFLPNVKLYLSGGGSSLHVTQQINFIQSDERDQLLIYAPKGEVTLNAANSSQLFRALIVAKKITLDNNTYIQGAVVTNDLVINAKTSAIIGDSNCFSPPIVPDVSTIEIKPFNYHLTCEASPENIVEVHVLDSNGNYVSGKTPSLSEVSGSNLDIHFLSESEGVAKYRVVKTRLSSVGTFPLLASLTLSDGSTVTDLDDIKYVPYKFDVVDKYLTAGENEQVTVDVKACDKSGQLISLGYTGSPTATFHYNQPNAIHLTSDLLFSARLNDTNREADLNFKESGHITVTIEDERFVCDEERCPVDGGSLKGEFDVYSRPYQLAICDIKETAKPSNENPASTTEVNGFMASGAEFSVTYIPIVHPDSKGSALNECKYPITGNYALDNGPIELTYDVIYPIPTPSYNPAPGTVEPATVPSFTSDSSTLTLKHTWSEVGSIAFNTGATYLTMPLDRDTQNIGRFYPNHFAVSESTWTAPDNQNGITYLSQPFESAVIKVAAFAYDSIDPVKNYRFFTNDLLATFDLQQDSVVDNVLELDVVSGSWQEHAGASYWVINDDAAQVNRDQSLSVSTITSKENGPFNIDTSLEPLSRSTNFGLVISGKHDPVSFDESDSLAEQVFPHQPQLRYGRMLLGSSGGTADHDLNVPLRIEYWDGSQFVINNDDSATIFATDSASVCKQILWSDDVDVSDTHLDTWVETQTPPITNPEQVDHGEVKSGVKLLAKKNDPPQREQVRFWLRLDDTAAIGHRSPQVSRAGVACGASSTAQPWLQYNWSDLGDEDPSTVATFGIFRGNDKIIFRGEPGLTGQ